MSATREASKDDLELVDKVVADPLGQTLAQMEALEELLEESSASKCFTTRALDDAPDANRLAQVQQHQGTSPQRTLAPPLASASLA